MFQQILYKSIDVTTSPLFNIIRKSFLFNKLSISVDCLKMVKEIGTLRAFQTVFHLKKRKKTAAAAGRYYNRQDDLTLYMD